MSIGRKVRQAGSGPLEDQPDYHGRAGWPGPSRSRSWAAHL